MDWVDVYWDAEIELHIALNNVSRDDFENAIRNPFGEDSSDSSGRPIRFGQASTAAGLWSSLNGWMRLLFYLSQRTPFNSR